MYVLMSVSTMLLGNCCQKHFHFTRLRYCRTQKWYSIVGALMLIKFFFNELSFLWNGCNIQYYYARNFIYYTISLWTSLILGNDRVLYIWKEVLYIGQQVVYTCNTLFTLTNISDEGTVSSIFAATTQCSLKIVCWLANESLHILLIWLQWQHLTMP